MVEVTSTDSTVASTVLLTLIHRLFKKLRVLKMEM